ncbi:MAG: hypothetical protein R3213_10475, partial [Flavobacteriaceae bacterium]|nr:hypothetical protein [Flavobacteriaceae bacterium]
MRKLSWHIKVRPSYYRGNFDYAQEGPFNRINNPSDNLIDSESMVITENDLDKIKESDLQKKKSQDMKVEMINDDEKYPNSNSPTVKNEIFKADKSYYEKNYTTRAKELKKVVDRDNGRDMRVIKANKKLAIIRGDEVRECPFGLPIVDACKHAGDSIGRMAPMDVAKEDSEKENLKKANRLVYLYNKTGKPCPFADKVLDNHDKVDCDYGDVGQGEKSTGLRGSPLYPSTFHGIGYDGMYGYPLGFYADNNESRNLFFGLFSLLGYHSVEDIVKLANDFDNAGETEQADILDKLIDKLSKTKEAHPEEFEKLEAHLKKYR